MHENIYFVVFKNCDGYTRPVGWRMTQDAADDFVRRLASDRDITLSLLKPFRDAYSDAWGKQFEKTWDPTEQRMRSGGWLPKDHPSRAAFAQLETEQRPQVKAIVDAAMDRELYNEHPSGVRDSKEDGYEVIPVARNPRDAVAAWEATS